MLTSPVDPSLYVAVALNCCVAPAKMLAVAGETAIAVTVFAGVETFSVALPLTPLSVAVTVVEPAAIAFTSPVEVTVATVWLAAVHVTDELTFAVEPSLYVAVAVNCWLAPGAKLALAGVTEIDVSVFVVLVEGDPIPLQPTLTTISDRESNEAQPENNL